MQNLAQGSVFDVVPSTDISSYIQKVLINSQEDIHESVDNVVAFLTHKCSKRYLVKTSDGSLRCRPKYICMTPDNTKQILLNYLTIYQTNFAKFSTK